MALEALRLDDLLVARGLASTKREAQALVRLGKVCVAGRPALKPGRRCLEGSELSVTPSERTFVSRGGDKLWPVLQAWAWPVAGRVALDVGAGTGGFTECLLMAGARKVYALDVGKGQLHWRLRQDPRVVPVEGINARYCTLNSLPEPCDLATMDVSFISALKVLPAILGLLRPEAEVAVLIKPQFEASPGKVGRGGVMRDPQVIKSVLGVVVSEACSRWGLQLLKMAPAGVPGIKGNQEFFALFHAVTGGALPDVEAMIIEAMASVSTSRPDQGNAGR